MNKKISQILLATIPLAVAVSAAALTISLVGLYGYLNQPTVTTTYTTTQTVTKTITTTSTSPQIEPSLSIVSSGGRCGDLKKPPLIFERDGDYVRLTYLESAGTPCYRHVIVNNTIFERWPPIIVIRLELEPTSDACVGCVGVIETALRVGPTPQGTEIVVNGLRITV